MAVLAAAAALVGADLALGLFTPAAALLEHLLTQAVLWPFILLDRPGLLPRRPSTWLLLLLGWAVACEVLARRGRAPGPRALLSTLTLLPVLVAVNFVLAALVAVPVVGCVALLLGVVAARRASTGATDSGLPDRPLHRLAVLALLGGLTAASGQLLVAGPGDGQLPFDLLAWLETRAPPAWLAGLSAGWGRVTLAVLCAAAAWVAGLLLPSGPRGSSPRLPWAAGALAAPVVAGVLGLGFMGATGFLGCGAVLAHPAVEQLDPRPGAFSLQPIPDAEGGPAVVVAWRDEGLLAWLRLDGSARVVHDLRGLDLPEWQRIPRDHRQIHPEELGMTPEGIVHAWVEAPSPVESRLRLQIDGDDGSLRGISIQPEGCFVSSWLWDAPRGRAVAGCEWSGAAMIEDAAGLRRVPIHGAGELEELVALPGGDWLATSLWANPYAQRIDPVALRVVDRALVGSFLWGAAVDTERGLVAIPRFLAGRVLLLGADDLAPRGSIRTGWGVRPIVSSRQRFITASTYDGHVYAIDPASGARSTLRLGGWVRDLDSLDDDSLLAAGQCGLLRVDLDRWLGERPPAGGTP